MSFLWFGKKRDDGFQQEMRASFDLVKEDIEKISDWIKHLHTKNKHHSSRFDEIFEEILQIKQDIDGLKDMKIMLQTPKKPRVFKHHQTPNTKQTAVWGVQTPVQTGVQTPIFNGFFENLSATERLIVWVILNSEMKLSCDDVAALSGKEKSTVRGHINRIKQKSEGLVQECLENNGKKRYYVPEEIRERLLRKNKVKTRRKSPQK
ncbi:MAG: hypothetical protein ABH817_02585 [archaeon]